MKARDERMIATDWDQGTEHASRAGRMSLVVNVIQNGGVRCVTACNQQPQRHSIRTTPRRSPVHFTRAFALEQDRSGTSKHWSFQVDLPANHLGQGWRRKQELSRRRAFADQFEILGWSGHGWPGLTRGFEQVY